MGHGHSHSHSHTHSHGHGHSHGQNSSRKTLTLAFVITLGYAFVEAVAGWFAGSLALIGDAGHMVTDSFALAIGVLAAWLASKPASARHSYGLKRAEVVGALFNVLFMYAVVAVIAVAAVSRLQEPAAVDFRAVILVGSVGLMINVFVAWLLSRGEQTLNSRAAMLHVLGDLLGSVAAIVAGIVIAITGWMPIDPLLSLLICALILWSSTHLLLETVEVVMESVPADIDLDTVRAGLAAVHPSIVGVHHLHVWTISSDTRALSAHVEVESVTQNDEVLSALEQEAQQRFNIGHGTYQLECSPRCDSDSRGTA